ncbi:MAG: NAD-dependent epimerase/dehydratase family protein [Pseudomonadales bacterium]|nr:NAD-dependent epimerase/dehydratase family protein [Pseudomonadales bacterium]NIX09230.1 NAD-dependent epimerase/dehydratase family protein [Pseudomonadales bacterium]
MPDDTPRPLIALTGATGFIGQHLQRVLLDAGCAVRALVRRRSLANPGLAAGVQIAEADLGSEPSLSQALEGVDQLVYAAGSVRGREPEDFALANVTGVRLCAAVLASREPGIPMLLISSLAASAPELSHYAASKQAGEDALRRSELGNWAIMRPPAVYGPGDKELKGTFAAIRRGLVPMVAPDDQHLPFIEVSDLANAVRAWSEHPDACAGKTFALHDGEPGGYDWPAIRRQIGPARTVALKVPYPLLDALSHVNLWLSRLLGYSPMLTPGKVRELTYMGWTCSNDAFTAATGWAPRFRLGAGVDAMFAH